MSCARYAMPHWRSVIARVPAWFARHPRREYIERCVLASPPWVNRRELYRLRDKARELTKRTGIEHTLDHIVPLNHPHVCGLNVPWNLRIVTRGANMVKSNDFVDHGELFGSEQLGLGLEAI